MSEWDDPVASHRITYDRITFDSKLELSWYLTMIREGMDVWWEPGRIDLKDGSYWMPDARVGDVLVEIKPWAGESTDRLWKPYAAADEYQLPVLVLRPGLVPADPTIEHAGLVWESCDSSEWVIVRSPYGTAKFSRLEDVGEEVAPEAVLSSADKVCLDSRLTGLVMAHWSEAK